MLSWVLLTYDSIDLFLKMSFAWRKTELPYEAVLMISTTNRTNGVVFRSKWWGGLLSPSTPANVCTWESDTEFWL